jgi:hypothetical protein
VLLFTDLPVRCRIRDAWFTVVENGKEDCVRLIVENRITGLPHGAAEAGSVSDNLKTGDIELGRTWGQKTGCE